MMRPLRFVAFQDACRLLASVQWNKKGEAARLSAHIRYPWVEFARLGLSVVVQTPIANHVVAVLAWQAGEPGGAPDLALALQVPFVVHLILQSIQYPGLFRGNNALTIPSIDCLLQTRFCTNTIAVAIAIVTPCRDRISASR